MTENCEIRIVKPNQLRLLPVTKKHLTQRYIAWLNNKEIVKFSELRHVTHTYESCYEYWKSFYEKPHLFWAIEIYNDEEWLHIGNVTAYLNEINKIADIGILIGEKSVWGKGYGTQVWKSVCDYLFMCHDVRKITAGTMSVNHGMLGIMKKSGMIEDGKRVRQYIFDNQEVDICYYALFKKNEQ